MASRKSSIKSLKVHAFRLGPICDLGAGSFTKGKKIGRPLLCDPDMCASPFLFMQTEFRVRGGFESLIKRGKMVKGFSRAVEEYSTFEVKTVNANLFIFS